MNTIGITMGCPSGIGPEIILKFFAEFFEKESRQVHPVVIGDINVLKYYSQLFGAPLPFHNWEPDKPQIDKSIPVLALTSMKPDEFEPGNPNRKTGKAMAIYIEEAVKLAQNGTIDGIVTCPISKASLHNAGYSYPGHTEMLAALTNMTSPVMMMAGDKLKVTLVTIHCPLKDVSSRLTTQRVFSLIEATHHALTVDFGILHPRIAVAGFNPHAGEDELFGSEENTAIIPAIKKARENALAVTGPYPPDTLFFKAAAGEYDAVICMYHDQGLIPFKLLHFEDGVNITLGLPIVRTSVDHGTAYDIAGRNAASSTSLARAVAMADTICTNRLQYMKRQC